MVISIDMVVYQRVSHGLRNEVITGGASYHHLEGIFQHGTTMNKWGFDGDTVKALYYQL
jgi:hypothetical protein